MFRTKVVEKNRNIFIFNNIFSPKIVQFMRYVKKYCRAGKATDDVWRMRFACWIPKATDTHSEYVVVIAFSTATLVERTRLDIML
jgi:hypothetical protein